MTTKVDVCLDVIPCMRYLVRIYQCSTERSKNFYNISRNVLKGKILLNLKISRKVTNDIRFENFTERKCDEIKFLFT